MASEMVASGRLGGVSGDKSTHDVKAAFEEVATIDIARIMGQTSLRQGALGLRMRGLRNLYMMQVRVRAAVQQVKKWTRAKILSGSLR
jgi:hypothetical protein